MASQTAAPGNPISDHPDLLTIPAELRLQIYGHFLSTADTSDFQSTHPIALLHLCSLIRIEAKDLYIEHVKFVLRQLTAQRDALVAKVDLGFMRIVHEKIALAKVAFLTKRISEEKPVIPYIKALVDLSCQEQSRRLNPPAFTQACRLLRREGRPACVSRLELESRLVSELSTVVKAEANEYLPPTGSYQRHGLTIEARQAALKIYSSKWTEASHLGLEGVLYRWMVQRLNR
ncbi:hypothetical protein LTR85_006680 [Meristemomyces frigidus]|nr:hypothetical protein LTR85_006680 [Meristemomyces frigidus]